MYRIRIKAPTKYIEHADGEKKKKTVLGFDLQPWVCVRALRVFMWWLFAGSVRAPGEVRLHAPEAQTKKACHEGLNPNS